MKYSVIHKKDVASCDAYILPVQQQDATETIVVSVLQSMSQSMTQSSDVVTAQDTVRIIDAARKRLTGRFAATTVVHMEHSDMVVVLVQMADKTHPSREEWKQAIRAGLDSLKNLQVQHLIVDYAAYTQQADEIKNMLRFVADYCYKFDYYKTDSYSKHPHSLQLTCVCFLCPDHVSADLVSLNQHIAAEIAGQEYAKNLANHPGNICTPSYLADQAQQMAQAHDLNVEILEEADMEKLGMFSFLAVAKGSTEPGKLIVIHYQGAAADEAPHVLVGKGITFDTGGISLKPAAAMDEMKFDMSGAASVLGTMKALAMLRPAINVTGIVAAAENMPDGQATRPGDIVTSMSGKTIEILNTDAEGRLVLCDALTYAERFEPASIIDIATLTGACVVALGAYRSGLFSNSKQLLQQLDALAEQHDDLVWPLPMDQHYQDQLKSTFADLGNIGGKREAGAVTAACFLGSFMQKQKWAHLDIAGTGWSGDTKKSTGRPVPLLLNYLLKA